MKGHPSRGRSDLHTVCSGGQTAQDVVRVSNMDGERDTFRRPEANNLPTCIPLEAAAYCASSSILLTKIRFGRNSGMPSCTLGMWDFSLLIPFCLVVSTSFLMSNLIYFIDKPSCGILGNLHDVGRGKARKS
jgi:hypothetical protein